MKFYHLLYCSKNRIAGSATQIDAQITAILNRSRDRNRQAGISGALMFNGAAFAQLLEGPLPAVEDLFEDIQCDDRHENIILLRNAPVDVRIFSDWSMAYADPQAMRTHRHAEIGLDAAFAEPTTSATAIVDLLRDLVIHAA
jgi:hypothetical protein